MITPENNHSHESGRPVDYELISPAEIGSEPLVLQPGGQLSVENYTPTISQEVAGWHFDSGAIVTGRPIMAVDIEVSGERQRLELFDARSESVEEYKYRTADSPENSAQIDFIEGVYVFGEDYEEGTSIATPRLGNDGLVAKTKTGEVNLDGQKGVIIANERYAIVVKDEQGQPIDYCGDLNNGSAWQNAGVSVSIGDEDKLIVTNTGEQSVAVTPASEEYGQPSFVEPYTGPINGHVVPERAYNPVTGEQVKPAQHQRRFFPMKFDANTGTIVYNSRS